MSEVVQLIPSRIKNAAVGGHIAGVEDIYDDSTSKTQATINQDIMNMAAMLMLANFAGLPTKVNGPEWKYILTDLEDKILFGKNQGNKWSFGDGTDDLMDAVLDAYAEDDTLFSNIYRLSVALSLARMSGTLSEIQSPEWIWVVLDAEDKVLMGIRNDYTWHLGATVNEILDAVITTYTVAGATNGTFANRPSNPNVGQMYFCTDKTAAGGSNQGIPIWYNGTSWVDSIGNTVS